MASRSVAVGVYDTHAQAAAAVGKLRQSGFDMKSLSVLGKDNRTEEHPVPFYDAGDRMRFWGKLGAFWGGLLALLFTPAIFFIPGLGPLIALGPIVAVILTGLEGAAVAGGLGLLGGALASIGVPADDSAHYESQLKAGKFLVIAHGTAEEAAKAHVTLSADAVEANLHNAAAGTSITGD